MAQIQEALLAFVKLITLLDEDGVVRWQWFGDPIGQTLMNVPGKRQPHLGKLIRALLDRTIEGADQTFLPGLAWEPINLGESVEAGFVWNTPPDATLQLGFGTKANIPGSPGIGLALLARLLKIQDGNLTAELGNIQFSGQFPVPDFLTSASLAGSLSPPEISLTVEDASAPPRTRTVELSSEALAWACIRLAVFVLQAWVHDQATSPSDDGFFQRLDEHLFPMLGEPESGAIKAFPLFIPLVDEANHPLVGEAKKMGEEPDFGPWKNSVLTTNNNAAGALTFLWHLRALLTGNESPGFLEGSFFFPLVAGPLGTQPPVLGGHTGSLGPNDNGAFVGITTVGNTPSFVLELRKGAQLPKVRITLAQNDGEKLTRPPIDPNTWTQINTFMQSGLPFDIGAKQLTATQLPDGWLLTCIHEQVTGTGLPLFDGTYKLHLVLKNNEPVGYRLDSPALDLDLPPPAADLHAAKKLFATVMQWLLSALPADQAGALAPVTQGLGVFISDSLTGSTPNPSHLLATLAAVLGNGAKIDAGPLSVEITNGHIKPALALGPIEIDAFHVGKLTAEAELIVTPGAPSPVHSLKLSLDDLRLGKVTGGVPSGLIGSLIPDLKQVPGFLIALAWNAQDGLIPSGGGKVPIQETLGPVEIASLLVDVRKNSFTVGVDLAFQLAMIRVTAFELGLRFQFDTGASEAFLHGLGVGFNASGIKLAGMFAEVPKPPAPSDYVGGAVVSVVNMFELSAIGGYTQLKGDTSSLFIFASLVAPLGGTPFCFLTGIAGGFGYNRALPPAGLLTKHPFMQVMSGEIGLSGGISTELVQLSNVFHPQAGQHWIAAGIQFVSFGFINGKLVVALGFGHDFSMTILGLAAFGIKPIAYFELGFEVTADKEKFLLKAGLSPNSYLIDPDIFSLRGDFGLGVWYAGDQAGDFVMSIGGYHPYFPRQPHYPELNRVGVKATLCGFVRLSVECFFACTPQALMAGAAVSLSAEFAGIGAGLHVYIDVFIRWEPFFMQARMGVVVWFEFFGRHEISVELEVHTPRFGGLAVIDLALVSFEMEFGDNIAKPPGPKLFQFFTRQIGVPAKEVNGGARVATFNTEATAGLIRIDFLYGRASKDQPTKSAQQEGVGTPVPVDAEFDFSVHTHLPLDVLNLNEGNLDEAKPPPHIPPGGGTVTVQGKVNLPLCEKKMDLDSVLRITVMADQQDEAKTEWLADYFPAASFGDNLSTAQADQLGARQAVGKANEQPATIALIEGIVFNYTAKPEPTGAEEVTARNNEDSLPDEEYPLPLSWPKTNPQVFRRTKPQRVLANAPPGVALRPRQSLSSRRQRALKQLASRVPGPLHLSTRSADVQRSMVASRVRALTVAAPPAGAVMMSPPPSPPRRFELFGVNLRVLPIHAPVPVKRARLETLSRARNLRTRRLTPTTGVPGPFTGAVPVNAGQAVLIDISADRIRGTGLVFAGQQTVRAIFLGRVNDLIADMYVTANQTVNAPARARRAVLMGEGFDPPIMNMPRVAGAGSPMAQESIGVEHDTVLLVLDRTVFAGHGCVLETHTPLPFSPEPLDSVSGFTVLRAATNFHVYFPIVRPNWSLVLTVAPTVANPESAADEVRWLSMDAALRDLHTVIGPDATALVMTVETTQPWSLEIDLGPHWRLTAAVVCGRGVRDLVTFLRSHSNWDLVDDRFQQPPAGTSTRVTVEVT